MHNYPPKILIAFGEALDGNKKIYQWLFQNGYRELAALVSSIMAKDDAFDWLMKHYPRFAAFTHAIEGSTEALAWLTKYKYGFLIIFAKACHDDENSLLWLKKKNLKIFIVLASKIKQLKIHQSQNNADYHKIKF